MAQNSNAGAPVLLAALILGASVVAGALLIRQSLEGTTREVAGLREALGRAPQAVPAAHLPIVDHLGVVAGDLLREGDACFAVELGKGRVHGAQMYRTILSSQ